MYDFLHLYEMRERFQLFANLQKKHREIAESLLDVVENLADKFDEQVYADEITDPDFSYKIPFRPEEVIHYSDLINFL